MVSGVPDWAVDATGGGGVSTHDLLNADVHTDVTNASASQGDLIYSDGADNWAALTLGANRAILQSDGTDIAWGNNLYIDGTASISDTLYVENTFTVASGSNIHSGTLYVDAATNRVGIGGTNPDETLTIFSTGADQFQLYHNTNDAVFYTTYGDFVFDHGNVGFVFDHGNVGINDSTPNALLEVAGTASISGGDFSVASSGWTSGDDYGPPLYVDVDTERVGIGTLVLERVIQATN